MPEGRPLLLLFTTFPVVTETFLQREVRVLAGREAGLQLWSCWGGATEWEGLPVRRAARVGWLGLLFWLPYWLIRSPGGVGRIVRSLFRRRPPNRINFGENLLGVALALRWAKDLERAEASGTLIHAVWASLPATVAWAAHELTGMRFSFAAHAYDLFEDGGDWLLSEKIGAADGVRTSTEAGRARLLAAGARAERVRVIRRGLETLPPMRPRRAPGASWRILSVGRLVKKMGYRLQIEAYAALRAAGVDFRADIIGGGPERASLEALVEAQGLTECVRFLGARPLEDVWRALAEADVALFTGVVAESGDRAGFPNFVAEAMAVGVPVVATRVGAVEEVLVNGANALLAETANELAEALRQIHADPEAARERAEAARAWVETHYRAEANMATLVAELEAWASPPMTGSE